MIVEMSCSDVESDAKTSVRPYSTSIVYYVLVKFVHCSV